MNKNFVSEKNNVFRLFVIFLASFLLFVYVFPWKNYGISIPFSWEDYKLWLDLQGWIELDYKVDLENVKKEEWENFTREREKEIIENLKKIIDKRVESLKINDSEINDASYWTEKHIIVQIPLKWTNAEENLKNIDAAKKAIWNVVKVSFKEPRTEEITEKDLQERKNIAENLVNELKAWEDFSVLKNKYSLNFELVEVWSISASGNENLSIDEKNNLDKVLSGNSFLEKNDLFKNINKILENSLNQNKKELLAKVQEEWLNYSKKRQEIDGNQNISLEEANFLWEIISVLSNNLNQEIAEILAKNKVLKENEVNKINFLNEDFFLVFKKNPEKNTDFILISSKPSNWINIVSKDWKTLDDKYLVKASVSANQIWESVIVLTFNDEGWKIFYEATSRLVWKPIAIFVGWEMVTSPNVNQAISWWQATITWQYTPQSAQKSADEINAWLVPAPIYLTSEKTIDSKIWAEALEKLIIAWAAWFLLMLIFLVVVYKASWIAAFLALVIYAIIVLSVIKALSVVLTLASIAWLILSVGMAIDANILIFERIKWELREWKKIDEALKIWFESSWSAIWDSNITWLLIAIILFVFGINMIKWFWLMLGIWIVVSLFTAMYVSRVFVKFLANNIKDKNIFIWLKEKNKK